MVATRRALLGLTIFSICGLWVLSASADMVTTGTPYYDGVTTWRGTSTFSYAPDPVLDGYVEWAVFAPGQFPFSNYTPTPGEYTYVYQLYNTASAAITNYSVALDHAADNIGMFVDGPNGVTGDQPLIPMKLYPAPGRRLLGLQSNP